MNYDLMVFILMVPTSIVVSI